MAISDARSSSARPSATRPPSASERIWCLMSWHFTLMASMFLRLSWYWRSSSAVMRRSTSRSVASCRVARIFCSEKSVKPQSTPWARRAMR